MPNVALSTKQLAVLKWVSGGCADGIYEGTAHRVVARALHNRGLIVVKGNGPSWVARMTDEGTRYLERNQHPIADARAGAPPPPGGHTPKKRKQGAVDQLMTSLAAAPEHRIVVPHSEAGKYRRLAGMAKSLDRVPDRFYISFGHVREPGGFMMTLTLEPMPAWQTKVLDLLSVARESSDPSDVVRALMDSETFPVTGEPRDRAFRLLEALVVGAREAGMTVETANQPHGRYGSAARAQDEITFRIGQDRFQLRFTQATLQRPHDPTERELARARRGYLFADFDEFPDEHLGLVLDGPGVQFWASKWKDTGDHRLEDDLAQVLEEIRLRHGYLTDLRVRKQEQDRQAQQARVERQKRLEAARARAALAYREHVIDEDARDQAQRWREANQMRAYAAEIQRRASALDTADRERARSWAERIAEVADSLDPFPDGAFAPRVIAKPSESDLERFIKL
jgi:hypothetical protein